MEYGHAASTVDRREIAELIKRYYTAAAAEDGALACKLIYNRLRSGANLVKAIPVAFAAAEGSSVFRGKSCAEVTTLLFEVDHARIVAGLATLQVVSVRLDGNHGLALLGFSATPERLIAVQRERGIWKIDALLDTEVP
jgi:hypothetical protein